MPIAPPPTTFTCPQCGWQKTAFPRSDVLVPGVDVWDACPRCGQAPDSRRAEGVLPALQGLLKKVLPLS
ncbi:MAG: hypothetical protein Q4F13_15865 [Pseudomonadota bacterium]|nr:hypothetical protein [Pseudomonadota bacterium]